MKKHLCFIGLVLSACNQAVQPTASVTPITTHQPPPPFNEETRKLATQKLMQLLEQHPKSAIKTMAAAIKTGQLLVDVTPTMGAGEANAASISCTSVDGTTVYRLGGSYLWLLDPTIPDTSRMLTLWHEYTHWHDYQSGVYKVKVCERNARPFSTQSDLYVAEWFLSELRANESECDLAMQLGIDHPDGWCQTLSSDGRTFFLSKVAQRLLQSKQLTKKQKELCVNEFQKYLNG